MKRFAFVQKRMAKLLQRNLFVDSSLIKYDGVQGLSRLYEDIVFMYHLSQASDLIPLQKVLFHHPSFDTGHHRILHSEQMHVTRGIRTSQKRKVKATLKGHI